MTSLYLASRSPRRRELLDQIGLAFHVIDVEVDESAQHDETPLALAERLARAKAVAGLASLGHHGKPVVIGADTVVVRDGTALGKPRDRDAARAMLASLGGRDHKVATGVAVASRASVRSALSVSQVRFRALSAHEIDAYVDTGEPDDKAGAYAIQGRAAVFVTRLEGSYSGVVGLPLDVLHGLLCG